MLHAAAVRAGYRQIAFESITSTNDEALTRARQEDPGKLWITAAAQSRGRGRVGRRWSSPAGNLYASLLLVGAAEARHSPELGFVAGLALARAVSGFVQDSSEVRIKWPNDLVHRGRKFAGVLVEGTQLPGGPLACVLGFGVNCGSHPSGLDYEVTDIGTFASRPVSPPALFEALSFEVVEALDLWDRGRNFAEVRTHWLAAAMPKGSRLRVGSSTPQTEGRFETIDHRGRLVLSTASGPMVVEAGDVFVTDRDRATA